jgi:hypothetical protein
LRTLTALSTLSSFATTLLATPTLPPLAGNISGLDRGFCRSFSCFTTLARQNVAPIDPDFDTNDAKGCVRLGLTVIDVGTQRMQGNLAFNLFLRARYFRASKTATNDNFDAFGIGTHRLLHRLFHRTTEGDAFLQLLRDAAPDQGGIQFRLADLDDLDPHTTLPGFRFQEASQFIDFFPAFANHNARLGGMNFHHHLVRGSTLDLDV